jgi:integration host factor subunit beta
MNKIDLIQALKDSNHLSKSESEAVINLFFDKIASALAQGDRVEIRGLCSFFVKKYKGYIGRNPKTGEKVKIAPKKRKRQFNPILTGLADRGMMSSKNREATSWARYPEPKSSNKNAATGNSTSTGGKRRV